MNWVLFDERFDYMAEGSGFDQVGDADDLKVHIFNDMPISRSGYLYVYVSNETEETPVFFDNLQVTHIRGPLLEENHYYPFGLTQAGVSNKIYGRSRTCLKCVDCNNNEIRCYRWQGAKKEGRIKKSGLISPVDSYPLF